MSALLWAYPARLRERHGAELITTMLDVSDGAPSRRDRWQLVLDGLVERFRLPAKRPLALVVAVLSLVIGGALGAAIGSRAGVAGYAHLPAADALAAQVLDPGPEVSTSRDRYYLSVQQDLADGDDQQVAAERIRQRLTAAGWATSGLTIGDGSDGILRNVHFRASNDGVELSILAYDYDTPFVQIAGWPERPAGYVPLVLGGALLGMLAGWLVAAGLSHRIAAAPRPGRSAVLASGGVLLLLVPSAAFLMSLLFYLSAVDPMGNGGLLHTGSQFEFGLSAQLAHEFGIPQDLEIYRLLAILGLAAVVVSALLAGPHRTPLVQETA